MVKKSKHERAHEPVPSHSFHLEHRYIDGLRFDGVWSYAARNSAGAWRWKALPLPETPSARVRLGGPQGAWWCARQCAAVMSTSAVSPQSLVKTQMPHSEPAALAQALQAFLPDCSVQMRECGDTASQAMDITVNMATDMAQVLQAGGCALLRLESLDRKVECNDSSPNVRWAWMVGMEAWHQARADRPMQGSTNSTVTDSTVHALLVVGPHWPAPWGSGFGAKLRPQVDGSWRLASADGEVMHCRVTACIAVLPAVPVVSTMPVSPVAGN
ncbi:hypothetical protein ACFIQF_01720 [Comamonas sp. J-3]|uniref:hypothetical protein n=1 Tax=Comamonas trifloxystrobinivorans TaxID=3350256 RepID=UPI0037278CC4